MSSSKSQTHFIHGQTSISEKAFMPQQFAHKRKNGARDSKKRYGSAYITKYNLDEAVFTNCTILKFDSYSAQWLDFIVECRRGNDTDKYNLVIGGVANDKVFNTCELYFRALISKETALERLRFEEPNIQYCFKDQETIDKYLSFIGSENL